MKNYQSQKCIITMPLFQEIILRLSCGQSSCRAKRYGGPCTNAHNFFLLSFIRNIQLFDLSQDCFLLFHILLK